MEAIMEPSYEILFKDQCGLEEFNQRILIDSFQKMLIVAKDNKQSLEDLLQLTKEFRFHIEEQLAILRYGEIPSSKKESVTPL
jgi:hypothetical protein